MRLRAAKTHRELFSEFYADLMREPLEAVLARNPAPAASVAFFERMLADIVCGGGASDPLEKVRPPLQPQDLGAVHTLACHKASAPGFQRFALACGPCELQQAA